MNKWIPWATIFAVAIGSYLILPIRSSATYAGHGGNRPESNTAAPTLDPQYYSNDRDVASSTTDEIQTDKPSNLTPNGKVLSAQKTNASPSILDTSIEQWKQTLSKEKGFESWQKAAWTSHPLGPGTHGWIVLLSKDGQEVGYMVVYAAVDGTLHLTEYGTGSKPLFSLTTLYQTLVQQEIIPNHLSYTQFLNLKSINKERIYLDSFQAIWKLKTPQSTYFIDAKTGELLPIRELDMPKKPEILTSGKSLTGKLEQHLFPSFDPYDRISWVKGKPLSVHQLDDLKTALQKYSQITLVVEVFNGKVTVPLAVLGYHLWNKDQAYLALDEDGRRFVPFPLAVTQGKFFP